MEKLTDRIHGDEPPAHTYGYLQTGQVTCHDVSGRGIPCAGSGQDAEFERGMRWPRLRFECEGELVRDGLTALVWTRNANPGELPMTWQEALDFVARMNREQVFGYCDWRLPNRRELRSLVSHQTRKPALPAGHPFRDVFPGWYWTSTTAAISPAHAWYVHMEGGRMFYGGKDQSFLAWPVRGGDNKMLPATGQTQCYDGLGRSIPCPGTGQDGETRCGARWPVPRFAADAETVTDRLTHLVWRRTADLTGGPTTWPEALTAVARFNRFHEHGSPWRLPNINELESLVDADTHSPAVPRGAPFRAVQGAYWSSTTSLFEPDWAWALYLDKGAVGVGQKRGAHFHVWAVRDAC